jgi:hypothetical protein
MGWTNGLILHTFRAKVSTLYVPSNPGAHGRIPVKLDKILWTFCTKKAQEPVDKIYGVLGIPCSRRFTITLDYSIGKEALYKSISILCIRKERYLNVLKGHMRRSISMPRWVQDWSTPLDEEDWMREMKFVEGTCYSASSDLRAEMNTDSEDKIILKGIFVDKVCGSTKSFNMYPMDKSLIVGLVYDWFRTCQLPRWQNILQSRYNTLSRSRESVFRSIITSDRRLGYTGSGPERTLSSEAASGHLVFKSWLCTAEIGDWSYLQKDGRVRESQYIVGGWSFYRSLFITSTGYMGMGRAQEGDEIWVLFGGNVPFILRPVPGSSEYTLVRDYYLHGIMDGEAVADFEGKVR